MAKATTPTVEVKTTTIELTNSINSTDANLLEVKTKILFNLVSLKEYLNFSVLERRIDLPNGTLVRFLEGKSSRVKPIHLTLLKKEISKIESLLNDLKTNCSTYEQSELFV